MTMNTVELQGAYIALVDIGMVWRLATPSAEDQQTYDGMPYRWSNYAHKVSSIILAHDSKAHRIICVNDPYDFPHSTKEDERDLRRHGNPFVPNHYMKLDDPFPSDKAFKLLLCSNSNKQRLQKLLAKYLTEIAQHVEAEIIYSVGTNCTNLSTQELMPVYNFNQAEADTIILSVYTVLRERGYNGPVVSDADDPDKYVAASAISHQQPGELYIKSKQELISCHDMVSDELSACIVQLHCFTGCDANSGFYGKGKGWFTNKLIRVKRRGDYPCIVGAV